MFFFVFNGINTNFPKQKIPGINGFSVNSIKYFRNNKLCQLSIISLRRWKQKEYFLTHSKQPALHQYQNLTEILPGKKIIDLYLLLTYIKILKKIWIHIYQWIKNISHDHVEYSQTGSTVESYCFSSYHQTRKEKSHGHINRYKTCISI